MAYPISSSQITIGAGIGTWTYTVPVLGTYAVSVFSTFSAPSGLVITINQNGSAVGPSPTTALPASQSEINIQARLNCAAGDVITVVLTDTVAQDQSIPTIKTIIDLHQGY